MWKEMNAVFDSPSAVKHSKIVKNSKLNAMMRFDAPPHLTANFTLINFVRSV